jgi:hypothetical protein
MNWMRRSVQASGSDVCGTFPPGLEGLGRDRGLGSRSGAAAAVDIDVSRNRQDPGPWTVPSRVKSRPGFQRPLESLLRQILRFWPRRRSIGQKAEYIPNWVSKKAVKLLASADVGCPFKGP